MQIELKIDYTDYIVNIPDDYTDIGRLTYKGNRPGVYATNQQGKRRFFYASRVANTGRKRA